MEKSKRAQKKGRVKTLEADPQSAKANPVKRVSHKRRYQVDENVNIVRDPAARSSAVFRVPSSLSIIRSLCRHLVHTNVYAKRAVTIRTSHIIGSGIRFHISSSNEAYGKAFQAWASSTACDHEDRKNLYGLQDMLVRMENEAGEGVAIMRDVINDETGEVWPTIQCVDPDMLADKVRTPVNAQGFVRSGVEYDKTGRVLGMHFRSKTEDDKISYAAPGSNAFSAINESETFFVPASDILHFFEPLYAGQLRGIPRGAQVLSLVEIHNSFIMAVLTKANVENCYSVAVKRVPSDSGLGGSLGEDEDDGYEPYPLENLVPGLVWYLRDGEEIQNINPSSNSSFEPFVRIGLEAICTGFGITYSQGSGDLSRVNFSSEKAGRLEFNRTIDSLRSIHFEPLMHRIERRFRECFILNRSPSVSIDADHQVGSSAYLGDVSVTLIPPARERIEPQKEALVEITELQSGALTWRQYIQSRGKDPDQQMAALKKERAELDELGVSLMFGSFETNVNRLAEAVQEEDEENEAQEALENNSTMFDRDRSS